MEATCLDCGRPLPYGEDSLRCSKCLKLYSAADTEAGATAVAHPRRARPTGVPLVAAAAILFALYGYRLANRPSDAPRPDTQSPSPRRVTVQEPMRVRESRRQPAGLWHGPLSIHGAAPNGCPAVGMKEFQASPAAPRTDPGSPDDQTLYRNNGRWLDGIHTAFSQIWWQVATADHPQVVRLGQKLVNAPGNLLGMPGPTYLWSDTDRAPGFLWNLKRDPAPFDSINWNGDRWATGGTTTYLTGGVSLALTVRRGGGIELGPVTASTISTRSGYRSAYLLALLDSLRALQQHPVLTLPGTGTTDDEITMKVLFTCDRKPGPLMK